MQKPSLRGVTGTLLIFIILWTGSRSGFVAAFFIFLLIAEPDIFSTTRKTSNRKKKYVIYIIIPILTFLLYYVWNKVGFQGTDESIRYSFSIEKFAAVSAEGDEPRLLIWLLYIFDQSLGEALLPMELWKPIPIATTVHSSFLKMMVMSGLFGMLLCLYVSYKLMWHSRGLRILAATALIIFINLNDIALIDGQFDFLLYGLFMNYERKVT